MRQLAEGNSMWLGSVWMVMGGVGLAGLLW
jgi:hypothetical protein